MKILQLCKKFPYPLKDGESLAVTYLSRALNDLGCAVTLLSMNTTKHFCDVATLPDTYDHYRAIHAVRVDNRINYWGALRNLFSNESYHVSRFVTPAFAEKLEAVLRRETFDVIQLETPILAPYIPLIRQHSDALVAMRAHNVEHEIWKRIGKNSRWWPLRWYLNTLTRRLKKFEIENFKNYDRLVAITERDLRIFQQLGYRRSGVVTPIGLNIADYPEHYDSYDGPLSIGFIGSLDWMPNQEGLEWFMKTVWTKTVDRFPELELHIAGRNPHKWSNSLRPPRAHFYGEVPCAKSFIHQHSIMIVPLLSGSGMRVKILEGMALGRVVITTSLGLEGIPATDGREVLIADTPEKMLEALRFCVEQPQRLREMGRRARAFVAREFDNRAIAARLLEAYRHEPTSVLQSTPQ